MRRIKLPKFALLNCVRYFLVDPGTEYTYTVTDILPHSSCCGGDIVPLCYCSLCLHEGSSSVRLGEVVVNASWS